MQLTNLPGHLWRDKWTALSGPLSITPLHRARRRSNVAHIRQSRPNVAYIRQSRSNVAHIRQSRPDSGLDLRAKFLKAF